MAIAKHAQFDAIQHPARSHDAVIMLGYSIFSIMFLVAVYLDSMSSGTASGDFASMTVFP
jgi:hypothetical protein